MTKTFRTVVALSIASEGIGLPDTSFIDIHGAITHILGWDVFTHELADAAVWERAAKNIGRANPRLGAYGLELATTPSNHADVLSRCLSEIGDTVELPEGMQERVEHPLESLARIAPDKPVIVVQV